MQPEIDKITLVIPCLNEGDCLRRLLPEVLGTLNTRLEKVIVVDDGSSDETPGYLARLSCFEPRLLVLTHPATLGQSSAIRTGVRAANTRWVATLDGDGQNPPDQILALITAFMALSSGQRRIGLAQGERAERRDDPSRRWASGFANMLRASILGDGIRDSACGLKLFRRDAYLELPYFEHIHRFMPAMMMREGWDVLVVPVTHRPRIAGTSRYSNLRRALVGVIDLAGAAWLIRRRGRIVPSGQTRLAPRAGSQ